MVSVSTRLPPPQQTYPPWCAATASSAPPPPSPRQWAPGTEILLRHSIQRCLRLRLWRNALFLAERLVAGNRTARNVLLLAECQFQAGQYRQLYHLLQQGQWKQVIVQQCAKRTHSSALKQQQQQRDGNSSSNNEEEEEEDDIAVLCEIQYLFAIVCCQLRRYAEARMALQQLLHLETVQLGNSEDSRQACNGSEGSCSVDPAALHYWLAVVVHKGESETELAAQHLRRALELDPFMWCAYEMLAELGVEVDCSHLYSTANADRLQAHYARKFGGHRLSEDREGCHNGGVSSNNRFGERSGVDDTGGLDKATSSSSLASILPYPSMQKTPRTFAVEETPHRDHGHLNGHSHSTGGNSNSSKSTHYSVFATPSSAFNISGISDIDSPHHTSLSSALLASSDHLASWSFNTPSPIPRAIGHSPVSLRMQRMRVMAQPSSNNLNGHAPDAASSNRPPIGARGSKFRSKVATRITFESPIVQNAGSIMSHHQSNIVTAATPKRRIITSTVATQRKQHQQHAHSLHRQKLSQQERQHEQQQQDHFQHTMQRVPTARRTVLFNANDVKSLLNLFETLAHAYKLSCQYRCREAVVQLSRLDWRQYQTGWVLSMVGRCYYEMADYAMSEKTFEMMLQLEPSRLDGLEIYSTVLWHLRKEKELSYLAHHMSDVDHLHPMTLCAIGNCFSLQRDHETAKRFFRRAQRLDPHHAYAFALAGHEYLASDDLDDAQSSFQEATLVDQRNYHAWYGMGTVYFRREEYGKALVHFNRALQINPRSARLYFHAGLAYIALQKPRKALQMIQNSVCLQPNHPLVRFKLASVLITLQQYNEALAELEQLRELVPRESEVVYTMGVVFRMLGHVERALLHFQMAMDLEVRDTQRALYRDAIADLQMEYQEQQQQQQQGDGEDECDEDEDENVDI